VIAVVAPALSSISLCFAADQAVGTEFESHGPVSIATGGIRTPGQFLVCANGRVAPIYVSPEDSSTVRLAGNAFAGDVLAVTGKRPKILEATTALRERNLVIIGTIGHSPLLDRLRKEGHLNTSAIDGKWESAITAVVQHPFPNVESALVIAGSDRRGTAYAVFEVSRRMGVSPWHWWADVQSRHHAFLAVNSGIYVQDSPSVKYRGIFLNDEDWGLRPWAARKMDPQLRNIGPNTYAHIFELLLRLRANTLWPAMHPGTLPFNAVPENAILADSWGIVMGSSHSEALLRNNVGEWSENRDGPWNYQLNAEAINRYWDNRLEVNGKFENFYTMGMRGVHDSGLEASGSLEVKAKLVEDVIAEQQELLAKRVGPKPSSIPQVFWLYKESLGLYRAGMKVPDDVTLGWTDDNYGYIRELPDEREQARSGGSALYYHVSYWGEPHDYLWLCSTPPALMREELSKAWAHGVRRLWILNVGDLKPAEMDTDYFLRMAWNEPATERISQREFLTEWNREQFSQHYADSIARLMEDYYQLNFIRKPEFMGFNENDKPVERSAFNPMAWGDQNRQRLFAWQKLSAQAEALELRLPPQYRDAYFELTAYPIEAAAAQNAKFLWNDRSYLDAAQSHCDLARTDAGNVHNAQNEIQRLTRKYNSVAGGKWDGIMSSKPRALRVFNEPASANQILDPNSLPHNWVESGNNQQAIEKGILSDEVHRTISINAVHFIGMHNTDAGFWQTRPELGLPGGSIFFGEPGRTPEAKWVNASNLSSTKPVSTDPWIEYKFTTAGTGDGKLSVFLLPTFPVDSEHRLRYAVTLDGGDPIVLDASGTEEHHVGVTTWSSNVLRNAEIQTLDLGIVRRGTHTMRLIYGDPGVIFQHLLITFSGAPPAYPFPPETIKWRPRANRTAEENRDSPMPIPTKVKATSHD
jgi:hypothetical protein